MVCLSTLAIRRATTWALRKSVSVNAARMEPSCSRQAKSMLRTSRLNRRAASIWARRSVNPSNEKRATRQRAAAILGLPHRAIEIAPEGGATEQAGVGIKDAFGLERFQHPLEPRFERLQAHERQQPSISRTGSPATRTRLGKPLLIESSVVEHADRQIAEAGVLGEHGEERLDDAQAQPVADDDAVDIAGR